MLARAQSSKSLSKFNSLRTRTFMFLRYLFYVSLTYGKGTGKDVKTSGLDKKIYTFMNSYLVSSRFIRKCLSETLTGIFIIFTIMAKQDITIKGSEGAVKGVIETGAREGGDFFAKLVLADYEPQESLFVTAETEAAAKALLDDLVLLAVKHKAI